MNKKSLFFIVVLVFCSTYFVSFNQVKAVNFKISDFGNWYLHSEINFDYYRTWSINNPDNYTEININAEEQGIYLVGRWISQQFPLGSMTFIPPHNWLSKIYAKGQNATLYFKLYRYNGTETLLYTSCESQELNNNSIIKAYVWQCKDYNTHVLNRNDRLLVKLYLNVLEPNNYTIAIDSNFTPSSITDPTEIRYFDTTSSDNVNGLDVYALRTSYTDGSIGQIPVGGGTSSTLVTGYWGIRVWNRTSGGVEKEITSGTPVAQVSHNLANWGYKSATWSCPQIPLTSTQSIVVRVYGKIGTGAWSQISYAIFTTEQLGASSLDSNTWTVYYNVRIKLISPTSYQYLYYWVQGTNPDLVDYIDGFKWTATTSTTTTTTSSTSTTSTTSTSTTSTISAITTTIKQIHILIKEPITPTDYFNEYIFNPILAWIDPNYIHYSTQNVECMDYMIADIYQNMQIIVNKNATDVNDSYVHECEDFQHEDYWVGGDHYFHNLEIYREQKHNCGFGTTNDPRRTYLKFNITNLPTMTKDGFNVTINQAIIRLYNVTYENAPYRAYILSYHVFDGNWNNTNETTLSWSNQPCPQQKTDAWVGSSSTLCNLTFTDNQTIDNTKNYIDFDVTYPVQYEYLRNNNSISIALRLNFEDPVNEGGWGFWSSENNMTYQPSLTIDYTINTPKENLLAKAMMCDLIENYECIKVLKNKNQKVIYYIC